MDREFDAIVVGAGAAGLVAALRAASGGARVALIERDASTPCNLAISGGLVAAAGTRWQAEAGVADDPARFAADLRAKAGEGIIDPVLLDTVTRRAAEALHFLADTVGLPLHLHTASAWPGQSAPRLHATPAESGAELCALLREAARAHPRIAWRDGTEVVGLVVDSDGAAVRGVEVSAAGRRSTLAAPHVVLACGGFGGAPAMLARFIPEAVGALHIGSPLSDGRAILWAEALGAALDCMDAYQGQPHVCLGGKARLGAALPALGAILVNRAGERFAREDMGPSELTAHILAQPGGMAVEIWHEAAHRAALQGGPFRAAVAAGAVERFDTPADLAARFGLPAAALAATLAEYAAAVASGGPDRLGRRRFAGTLEPPLYAAAVTGGLAHTQGGVRVDGAARVLRAAKDGVIPGLYAAGGVACGVSGRGAAGYIPGNGLAQSFALGFAAGTACAGA
ncbi:MAG: FAD-binding protein [Acetobacteraceae bacterium]|nr:FAD-binding protein [Acetobacteraceae bacterium]